MTIADFLDTFFTLKDPGMYTTEEKLIIREAIRDLLSEGQLVTYDDHLAALATAEEKGRREMREEAAKVCDNWGGHNAMVCAERIRKLPDKKEDK